MSFGGTLALPKLKPDLQTRNMKFDQFLICITALIFSQRANASSVMFPTINHKSLHYCSHNWFSSKPVAVKFARVSDGYRSRVFDVKSTSLPRGMTRRLQVCWRISFVTTEPILPIGEYTISYCFSRYENKTPYTSPVSLIIDEKSPWSMHGTLMEAKNYQGLIALTSNVHDDGVADAAFLISFHRWVRKYFQNADICWAVGDTHQDHAGKRYIDDIRATESDIKNDNKLSVTVVEGGVINKLTRPCYENANIVISAPYWSPEVPGADLALEELSANSFRPGDSIIMPQGVRKIANFAEFTDKHMKNLFESSNKPYFAYFKSGFGQFLEGVEALHPASDGRIHVITNGYSKRYSNVKVFDYTNGVKTLKMGGDDNNIVLHVFGHLPHTEFLKCLVESRDYIGVTGDQSFLEVLSIGKIPYHDHRKLAVGSGLRYVVQRIFGEKSKLYLTSLYGTAKDDHFFMKGVIPEDLPEIRREMKIVVDYIRTELSPVHVILPKILHVLRTKKSKSK